MPNTISKETLDKMANQMQKNFEAEKKLLESMTEEERIAYMAVQASFSHPLT